MIWAGLTFDGKTELQFISTRMNAKLYQNVLEDYLLPVLDEIPLVKRREMVFLQDNAPIRRAKTTMEGLRNNRISVMPWPPYSPDLNPIENVWGVLARRVYANGRQFNSTGELRSTISTVWNELNSKDLNPFALSMPGRVADVLLKNGGSIDK